MNHDETTYRGSLPKNVAALRTWHDAGPGEAALEPELQIVDPHHHLFGETTDAQYYRRPDLERDLKGGHRIVGTVYVEAYASGWRTSGPEHLRPVGEVEMIAGRVAGPANTPYGHCEVAAGIVAHADLTLGHAVNEVLEAQVDAAQGRLRGIRQLAAHDDGLVGRFIQHLPKQHLLADAGFRAGLAQLHRHGLTFDVWIYHHQMRELIELVDSLPKTTFILDHVGGLIGVGEFRSEREAAFDAWREDLRRLAARPNVFVKVGGMGMPVFGFGFEHRTQPPTSTELAQAWRPLIEVVLEAFGTQRCMFESNFPVDRQSCGYTELWNAFKLATRSLSPSERGDLFHRTACRVYRLELDTWSRRHATCCTAT
ncbi:amidohydrolase family protein [Cupriavidus alkaliphilus]|uniref:amidohydrolase family protein n=1 Tax=Cupriavidus alkaliphilus TaxID=942866 RepID=UPI00161968D1|nr:amidohydrolase family protein [Cupriavidus alkaliphilus]MBB3014090.1 putative TIM-barrel fold metal-dependent hydrolase [Cupriavidus alkaliphilus]